jgi:thiosulfate dehydrogenase [quinone] large subunit
MTSASDRAWAILIARTLLGLVFFVAGIYKTFMWGPLEHARVLFVEPYAQTYLPIWGLWASGAVIPFIELIAGGLVLVGLWTRPSLFVLGGILLFVAFGHLVRQPGTSLNAFILPRSALLLIVLLTPAAADRYSLDSLRRRATGPGHAAG